MAPLIDECLERKRRPNMKWGGTNREAEARMKKLLSGKTMYCLLMIVALGLLLAESFKWHP